MKRQGISLIVLIITILIIVIIATTIVVNLVQIDIIKNADEAVVKQDFKVLQQELNKYISDKYIETLGKFVIESLNANKTTTPTIYEILPNLQKSGYKDYVVIENGKIIILDTMSEPQKTWAMEAINNIKMSTNIPLETDTPIVKVEDYVIGENATITGNKPKYDNPVIPVGFRAINTAGAKWIDTNNDGIVDGWNDGLVIEDINNNQFVWVPVDKTNVTYTKRLNEYPVHPNINITGVEDDAGVLPIVDDVTIDEKSQIIKYGGFYIGRYEAGVPADQTIIDGTSDITSDVIGTPVVKKDAIVWTNISYSNAVKNAKSLYNTDNIKSGLITGTQWDTACTWIASEKDSDGNIKYDVLNSISWGNYINTTGSAQYNTDGVTKISGAKHTAGYSEYWKAKNIYDMAGNTSEWNGEYYMLRGGEFFDGSSYPISFRNYFRSTYIFVSFRIVLYIM